MNFYESSLIRYIKDVFVKSLMTIDVEVPTVYEQILYKIFNVKNLSEI